VVENLPGEFVDPFEEPGVFPGSTATPDFGGNG
jgi:hypothetical protein